MTGKRFAVAADGVDPAKVPKRVLASGARMPAIGLGTFGSDRFSGEQIAAAVEGALDVGYRHIDCASVYGNEHLIGEAFERSRKKGLRREELWINSKVWNDMHDSVAAACEKSLRDLRLDYLDLYLVHWPFPNFHPKGATGDSRDPNARPYIHEEFMRVWAQMEGLVSRGLVRHIGTSNMTVPKLKLLLRDAAIKPACNEMELHPHFQQPGLFSYAVENGIVPIGFCPIGSPTRPDRDRTDTDTVDIEDPVVVRIARRLGVHPAVVCVKWAVQRGQVPIPFSVYRAEYLSNLQSTVFEPLTVEDMRELAAVDKDCRLIKGQVFLWQGARSWEDLWDVDGVIASP
jgi:alcohol dehydrogenase (NADP+)